MSLYKNKYRVESTRLQNWDYGWTGKYFITIVTKNRNRFFGKIINDKMNLSNIGIIANVIWNEITNHANNVELNTFTVMPNHIHGILFLKNNYGRGGNDDNNNNCRDNACVVSTNTTNTTTKKMI